MGFGKVHIVMCVVADIYTIVGKRIRELRKRLKLTQEELAFRSGLDFRSIGAVERGERNLSLKSLNAIAKALKVKPEFLIKEEQEKPKEEKQMLLQEMFYLLQDEGADKIRFILNDAKAFLQYEKQKRKRVKRV